MTHLEAATPPPATAKTSAVQRWLTRLDTRALLTGAALFALFSALFAFVQFGTSALADNDGFCHLRMAALMRAYGLRVPFTWLPLSILNQDAFYDHHLLYHVYLALFAGGSDQAMLTAAKWASVFMPAAAFVAVWWLLRGQQVRYAAIWTLGLFAVSEAFLYRMSMPRAQAASLLVLALGLHWLLQRKFVWLIPLGFLYVWLYNAFPLLIVISLVYAGATFLTERRIEWKAVVYPGVGIALGLIINPYFPQNITFIINHLAPKIGELGASVGNEWYPYDTWVLVQNSGFALAAFIVGAFALGWRGQKIDRSARQSFAGSNPANRIRSHNGTKSACADWRPSRRRSASCTGRRDFESPARRSRKTLTRTLPSLRFGSGLPIQDVARTLGKTEGAIKQLQARAVAALARKLSPQAVK